MENLYLVFLSPLVVVAVLSIAYWLKQSRRHMRPALRSVARFLRLVPCLLIFLVVTTVFAQDRPKPREGAYPVVWFDKTPLPVGTHVWINYPDTACGLLDWEKYYPLLKVDRRCFNFESNRFGFDDNVYIRAVVTGVKTKIGGEGLYYYTLEVVGSSREDNDSFNEYFRTNTWGHLFEMFNVNDERTAWGKYILILGL